MLPKTFCVLPFSQLTIANDGKVKLCTHAHAFDITSEERALSLHSTPLEEIWNSAYLRTIRRRMVEGSPVVDCSKCYRTEAEGGTSLRQVMNLHAGCRADGMGEGDSFQRARNIVTQKSGNAPPPSALHLWLGNLCNLKCRMCSPAFSSRVASDPVQSKWLGELGPAETPSRIPQHVYWSQSEKVVFEEVFSHPELLSWVHFSGGEPLLHRSFLDIVQKLVDGGHASHIRVYINSNGTVYSHRLSSLLKEFLSVELAISLDGIDKLQEYIRPPSKWDTVSRNIFAFRKDGIPLSVRPTVQAYNVFGLLELVRWCETNGLHFFLDNVLTAPRFLSFDILPQLVVDEALQCWTQYLNAECTDTNRWHVETVIAALRRPRPEANDISSLQQQFVQFTHDIDRSADQFLAIACPRLYERLMAAGFEFSPALEAKPQSR
ncbi:MAG: twitch domain-containing radical SAM protein [Verrucomicrobia bacterium]|nr:twitch domain-containing radical SAM protein [Verrucomicrobiota bacterium]